MLEKYKALFTTASVCLLTMLFATSAEAQTVAVQNPVTYAKELFADAQNPTLSTGSTNTTVTLVYDFSTNGIDQSATGDFVFSLQSGARFATAAAQGDFTFASGNTADAPTIAVQTGGGIGTSSVTYRVTAAAALSNANSTFTFTLPNVDNAATALGRGAAVRNPDAANSESDLILCVEVENPTGTNTFDAYGREDFVVASSKYAFTMAQTYRTGTATSTARVINASDRRTLGTLANFTYEVTIPGRSPNPTAVAISTLTLENESGVADASGTALAPASGDVLNVSVTGPFAEDDVLFFSPDTIMAQATEELTVTTAGMPERDVSLDLTDVLSTNPRSLTLYYVPDGVTAISQKQIDTSYTLDLQQSSNNYHDQTLEPLSVTLLIEGVYYQGYAYAIPPPTATDIGNVRIRCQEGVETCVVYLNCKDAAGMQVGNNGDGTLPSITLRGGEIRTLQSRRPTGINSLPTALGVPTWIGRISCNILSTNAIGVQILTRSGGVLVNNTYVSGTLDNK